MALHHDMLEKLFNPFFTTKPPGEGTGLGLSVVQSIIHSFGGRIKVVSEFGVGTAFTLSLPLILLQKINSIVKKN